MTFRLDEVIGNTDNVDYDEIADRLGVDESDMYDLLCCQYNTGDSLQIGDYKFEYKRTVKKHIEDYCEGKCSYYYDITVTDKNTGDAYNIICSHYNDEITGIEVEYIGNKKSQEKAKTCCTTPNLVTVKASDIGKVDIEMASNNYDIVPGFLRIGSANNLEFKYCFNCGKMHLD